MKKNVKDLEKMIEDRANDVVQDKIKKFKYEIELAVEKLVGLGRGDLKFGSYCKHEASTNVYRLAAAYIVCLISNDQDPETAKAYSWPALLWEKERDAIRNELLAKMDLMQQLLMTKPRSNDDDVPCEGDSEGE